MSLRSVSASICICACLIGLPSSAWALLLDNGGYTTDTDSGLDWLDLDVTRNLSYDDAHIANMGWKYASNSEMENLFSIAFPGYVHTSINNFAIGEGGSLLSAQAIEFNLLFGGVQTISSGISYGWYRDEDDKIRMMGTDVTFFNERVYVFSDEHVSEYGASSSHTYYGTYLVREVSVPEPSVLWLIYVGLISMLAVSKNKKAHLVNG